MRDPDRIDRILDLLSRYWRENPDMRLAQIVGNVMIGADPYHLEDILLEEFLRRKVS